MVAYKDGKCHLGTYNPYREIKDASNIIDETEPVWFISREKSSQQSQFTNWAPGEYSTYFALPSLMANNLRFLVGLTILGPFKPHIWHIFKKI